MSDLRKAAQDVVNVWKIYGTVESLRGWMDILEAALAQQPEPAQEPEPVPTHRLNSWGFCGVCRHDRILGEGCARQECPDSPQQPEPAQEPVAGAVLNADGRPALVDNGTEDWHCKRRNARRLYTAPQPQRPPLTDEEIDRLWRDPQQRYWHYREFARAVERAVRGGVR